MSATTPPGAGEAQRSNVVLIVVGSLGALSVVIAALVIFSGGQGTAPTADATAPVSAGEHAVLVGPDDAPTKVVVYEDYASPQSREFEMSSRDFLRIEAAHGLVQVEYRPFVESGNTYARDALMAWAGLLGSGTPKQALTFHDVLFDRQPSTGPRVPREFLAWARDRGIDDPRLLDAMGVPDPGAVSAADQAAAAAGVRRSPAVLVDGTRVSTDPTSGSTGDPVDPTELADRLQRMLLEEK